VKKIKKFTLNHFGLFLGLGLFFSPFYFVANTAWSQTSSLPNNPISKEPQIKDVESWGAFRGWSQEVPYGQNPLDRINKSKLNNKSEANEKGSIVIDKKDLNSSPIEINSSDEDDELSSGAFRGWSPRVPYGK